MIRIIILFFVLVLITVNLFANNSFNNYPHELTHAVQLIEKLPEARQLLAKIHKEGNIGIELGTQDTGNFNGLWVANRRVIIINPDHLKNEGSLICTILFEMHNAYTNTRFLKLVNLASQGKISKEQYVENIERMEHANALSTCRILEKGMNMGIFPRTSTWSIFTDFESHYMVQQIQGHSQWLANSYESMSPLHGQAFKGTIPYLDRMTALDKKDMLRYFSVKFDLDSTNLEIKLRGAILLQLEYARLEGCAKGIYQEDCHRSAQCTKLLHDVLKSHQFYRLIATSS